MAAMTSAEMPPIERSDPVPRILCAGVIALDEVFRVEEFPRPDGKVQANGFFVVTGGCAANAAVAIARLGGRALVAGPMGGPKGKDANGDRVLRALKREHVDCTFCQRIPGLATALSTIFMNARGDRTIVTYCDERIAATTPTDADAAVAVADVLLADNCFPDFVQPICAAARRRRLPVVLDGDRRTVENDPLFRLATHRHLFFAMLARDDRHGRSRRRPQAHRMQYQRVHRREQRAERHPLSRGRRGAALAGIQHHCRRHDWRRRRLSRRLCAGAGRGPRRSRGHALRRRGGRDQMHSARRLGGHAETVRGRGTHRPVPPTGGRAVVSFHTEALPPQVYEATTSKLLFDWRSCSDGELASQSCCSARTGRCRSRAETAILHARNGQGAGSVE